MLPILFAFVCILRDVLGDYFFQLVHLLKGLLDLLLLLRMLPLRIVSMEWAMVEYVLRSQISIARLLAAVASSQV